MTAQREEWVANPLVKQIDALRSEFEVAIEAITHNDLGRFEESLWNQEHLCARLAELVSLTPRSHLSSSSWAKTMASPAKALHILCELYAEVLSQARCTNLSLYSMAEGHRSLSSRLIIPLACPDSLSRRNPWLG